MVIIDAPLIPEVKLFMLINVCVFWVKNNILFFICTNLFKKNWTLQLGPPFFLFSIIVICYFAIKNELMILLLTVKVLWTWRPMCANLSILWKQKQDAHVALYAQLIESATSGNEIKHLQTVWTKALETLSLRGWKFVDGNISVLFPSALNSRDKIPCRATATDSANEQMILLVSKVKDHN